jgi:hypothetical protein
MGRMRSSTPKINTSKVPTTKTGVDIPSEEKVVLNQSMKLLRWVEDRMPRGIPKRMARKMPASTSSKVRGMRLESSSQTGRPFDREFPKSNEKMPFTQVLYWVRMGLSSPRLARTEAITSGEGVDSEPSTIMTGSPGSRCNRLKTTVATRRTCRMARPIRITM